MIQLTVSMVRALAGFPITVLVLLALEKKPASQSYIRRHTGFSEHTVQDSVELLADYGMITQTGRYTWQIADGVQQLPLGAFGLPEETEPEQNEPVEEAESKPESADEDEPVDNFVDNRSHTVRPNPLASSSRSLTPESDSKDLLLARAASSHDVRPNSSQKTKQEIDQILAALDDAGIDEPKRSQLAQMPHVTVELICYHRKQVEAKDLALAIWKIEHNRKIPKEPASPEDRRRYVEGEYADFIEH